MTSLQGYPGTDDPPRRTLGYERSHPTPDPAPQGRQDALARPAAHPPQWALDAPQTPLLVNTAKSVGRIVEKPHLTSANADPKVGQDPGGPGGSPEGAAQEHVRVTEARVNRWRALDALWQLSTLDRVRTCGRVAVRPSGTVDVRRTADAVGYAGLATCGSVWACPRCSAKIQAVRRLELGVMVTAAANSGMTIAFGTVTLRHRAGQPLGQLWDAVTKGYQAVGQSSRVRRLRAALGRVGYVRALEVTKGANGWHPHLHTISLFEKPVTQAQLDELADAEFSIWKGQAKKRGLGAPMRERYELRLVTDANNGFADYFAKAVYEGQLSDAARGVSFEMTGSLTKAGRGGKPMRDAKGRLRNVTHGASRTPWQILDDFLASGDMDDWDSWEEYERASKGRRALVWSPGLKARFAVEEQSDETIAGEEVGSRDDVVFTITDWAPIAARSELGGLLLNAVRSGGMLGGLAFCHEHGIPTVVQSVSADAA